jgi:acetoin utilization deacetylase AcuC-like enzyme
MNLYSFFITQPYYTQIVPYSIGVIMGYTMIVHSPLSLAHDTGLHHVESSLRYVSIINALRQSGFLTKKTEWIASPELEKWLFLCHSRSYVRLVKESCRALREKEVAVLRTGDVKICKDSYAAALAMVEGALHAIDCIMEGQVKNAFLVARPPGHHAERSKGMGFCLFNTVAIAARYLQREYGLKRIAIIDWDVHHGNGTEKEFSDDPSVFYFSTHQKGGYPGTGETDFSGVSGNIRNFQIAPGLDAREVCMRCYQEDLPKAMEKFRPQFVLISCGFDAHKMDPIASLTLETEDYGTLTKIVQEIANRWCDGHLLSVLEGGYHVESLAQCAVLHVKELSSQGDPYKRLFN